MACAAGAALELAWKIMRRTDEPRMTRFLAAQLGTSHYFNIDAARRDFGYEPKISMADGMKKLAASLRADARRG
jgi:nucleoside-diphosphate-sugar epimerase